MACRLSAFIARESALRPLQETFCTALERARDCANAAIRQYRMHADVSGVTKEVSEIYKRVMVYAAYMLGHIDGIEGEVAALVPKAMDALERHPCFSGGCVYRWNDKDQPDILNTEFADSGSTCTAIFSGRHPE